MPIKTIQSFLNNLGGALRSPKVEASQVSNRLNNNSGGDPSSTLAFSTRPQVTKRLEALTINAFFTQAKGALSEIATLRERQLELAKEAKDEVNPERRERLDTEFQSLQGEISRVQASANFNDLNAISGLVVFSVSSSTENINQVSGKGDSSSLASDLNLSLLSQSSAESAKTTVAGLLSVTRVAASDADKALSESERDIEKLIDAERSARAADPDEPQNIEEAEELAGRIVDKLRSKGESQLFSGPISSDYSGLLVNNLDAVRVEVLVEESR